MTLRFWKDPRDGRYWKLRQTGLPTMLLFESEADLFSVVIDFNDKLEDRSDEELQRLLDEGRASS
jgi:hypothetical protein